MTLHADNIRWEILESEADFFNKHCLDNPESLIRECHVIKEGNKRVVYRNETSGFYIKCTQPRKARKEWKNWKVLYETGLPTITPVALGISQDYGYLISLAHDDCIGLYEVFDTSGYRKRLRLLKRMGQIVKAMHRAGFYHGDLHGGNFIACLNGDCAYIKMVDFQKGGFKKLSCRRRLTNLADLALSHFFRLGIKERLAFLTGYCGSSQLTRVFIRDKSRQLERLILKRSSLVADHKVRKCRKINEYFDRFVVQADQYRGVYIRKNRDIIPESFLFSPVEWIYGKHVKVLKDSRSVRVVRYQDICIKYYKRRNPKDLLKSWLGLSKGKKSFRWALAIIYRFIMTPEPLCYLEGRNGDSFYLARFVDFADNLTVYLQKEPEEQRKACLKALASFLSGMFYRGVYHMDLKSSNILVRSNGLEFEFFLIDVDEMSVFWKGSPALLKKCLLRITSSLVSCFGRQDLVAFVNACLSGLPILPLTETPQQLVNQAFKIQAMQQS
jgi:tRNA A-37 threonylcarbamoyl transferase component Bud32